jgi:hypothetical protein
MIINFAVFLAVLASLCYLIALLPIQKIDSFRKQISIFSLILSLVHLGIMVWVKNLSLFEAATYQKCLPIITIFLVLTAIGFFYRQISNFAVSLKIFKSVFK